MTGGMKRLNNTKQQSKPRGKKKRSEKEKANSSWTREKENEQC
jgi:hypothetical protein